MPGVKRRRSRTNRPAKKRMTKKFMQNYARRRRRATTRIKKTILKMSETKYKSFYANDMNDAFDPDGGILNDRNETSRRLGHNRITRVRLWDETTTAANGLWPQPGDQDSSREGDRINCTGFKVRGKFQL